LYFGVIGPESFDDQARIYLVKFFDRDKNVDDPDRAEVESSEERFRDAIASHGAVRRG
jgi:hypothetical protein